MILFLYLRKVLAVCLAVLMVGNFYISRGNLDEQKAFDEFIDKEFVDTMEDNWLNAHIFMENPEDFGVDMTNVDVELSEPPGDAYFEKAKAENEKCAEAFREFHRENLTDVQKDTYDIYAYMLDVALESVRDEFKYISFDFSTLSGSYNQIPTLLADLQLRNESDAQALVELVRSVKTYLDGSAAFLKEQEAHGTLIIDIDEVRGYCENIVSVGMDSSTLASMKENVDGIDMDQDLKDSYHAALDEAFREAYLPAYENILSVLDTIDESKIVPGGLATIDHGREAYEMLFRSATGTSRSIEDVQRMLEERLGDAIGELQMLLYSSAEAEEAYQQFLDGSISTGYEDFESMLEDLAVMIREDFPDVGPLNYDIRPLPKDLELSGVLAYYNTPALDQTGKQNIRVNMAADTVDIGSIDTFLTVAHEGIPGHMYQFNYCYRLDLPAWRKTVAVSSGFTEGYATYVQFYVLKYLEDIDGTVRRLQRLMTEIDDMAVALADIGIHYEGWSREELADFFESHGLNREAAADLYDYLRVNPAVFLSYYVGYAEIMELREKAQEELGDRFDEKGFHAALLEDSGGIFDVVARSVDAYIEAKALK